MPALLKHEHISHTKLQQIFIPAIKRHIHIEAIEDKLLAAGEDKYIFVLTINKQKDKIVFINNGQTIIINNVEQCIVGQLCRWWNFAEVLSASVWFVRIANLQQQQQQQ